MPNYGIAQGLERGTSNIMNIMMQKKKLDQQKEQNKIINKYRTAQTDMLDMKLKQAAKKSKRQEDMFKTVMNQVKGFSAGSGQGQSYGGGGDISGGRENPYLNLPMGGRNTPSGGNTGMTPQDFDWNMNTSGEMSFSRRDKEKQFKEDIIKRYRSDPNSVSAEEKYKIGLGKSTEIDEKTQEQLDLIADAISDGSISSQAQALQILEGNKDALIAKGINVESIEQKIKEALPEDYSYQKGKSGFLGMGKIADKKTRNGITYEKREDGKWHPVTK